MMATPPMSVVIKTQVIANAEIVPETEVLGVAESIPRIEKLTKRAAEEVRGRA